MNDRLNIAIVSPPVLPVPPPTYAGTERVVAALVGELVDRGHQVTLFAPGDSKTGAELVASPQQSLWSTGHRGDGRSFTDITLARVWSQHDRFDIIHSHVETAAFLFARHCPTPVLSTLHGRLDTAGIPELLEEFCEIPLVAISDSQRRWFPNANWIATIHHGLPLRAEPFRDEPGSYLAFVGRVMPEKGVAECIELARRTRLPLRIAAKVQTLEEKKHFARVVEPAVRDGVAEYLGELGQPERDALYAGALATLMLGAWPEPFGLVAIESMATGTPVIARRAGALTETIEHGRDGYLVDDLDEAVFALSKVASLDRRQLRQRVTERFAPQRMTDEYEQAYRAVIEAAREGRQARARPGDDQELRADRRSGRHKGSGGGAKRAATG